MSGQKRKRIAECKEALKKLEDRGDNAIIAAVEFYAEGMRAGVRIAENKAETKPETKAG